MVVVVTVPPRQVRSLQEAGEGMEQVDRSGGIVMTVSPDFPLGQGRQGGLDCRILSPQSTFHRTWFDWSLNKRTVNCNTQPSDIRDGPMPTITDSLFSLIIFIYVMVTFLFFS